MNIKHVLLSKKTQQHGGYTKPLHLWVTMSLHKIECLPVITRNNKHSSKQVVSILGKDFFAAATLKGFFSDRVKRLVVCFGLHESSLHFYRKEDQKDSVYKKKI